MTTGHERDVETGLDYRGARFYDSDVARFLSLDPAAMEYPHHSDYCYVAGNPTMFVDPDGKRIRPIGSLRFRMKIYAYTVIMGIKGEKELRRKVRKVVFSKELYKIKDVGEGDMWTGTGISRDDPNTVTMATKRHHALVGKIKDGVYSFVENSLYTDYANELSHLYDFVTNAPETDEIIIHTWEKNWILPDGETIPNKTKEDIHEVRSNQFENMARAIVGMKSRHESIRHASSFTTKELTQNFIKLMKLAQTGGSAGKLNQIYNSSSEISEEYDEWKKYLNIPNLPLMEEAEESND